MQDTFFRALKNSTVKYFIVYIYWSLFSQSHIVWPVDDIGNCFDSHVLSYAIVTVIA